MIEELIQGFDSGLLCELLNAKFSGAFSAVSKSIAVEDDLPWERAEQLGVVKTLPGPNELNMPLLVVAVELSEGEELRERSSRIRQFRFAKKVLDDAMSNPSPGVEGIISQGLFVFYDDSGNFRLSLVYGKPEGTKLVWSAVRRLSFYIEAGAGNKTLRDRAALSWSSFDKLKEAFSVEKLAKEFYKQLFAWYQRAMESEDVVFPNDVVKDKEPGEVKSEQIIRLITRLMFVWFLKQKHLIPDTLFDPGKLESILKDFKASSGVNYYRAILQNLFFATLNSVIGERDCAFNEGYPKNRKTHNVGNLYRYENEFVSKKNTKAEKKRTILAVFEKIPFLNGGLFECLDKRVDNPKEETRYYDGFSRNKKKQARVPNAFFFDRKDGLIPLLSQYNFTVEENSPGDEEVALDPELLGKVFENLLGAYNPETKVAARKATGSFYTPREIVNYMVDESLVAHLKARCGEEHEESIRKLFDNGEHPEDKALCEQLGEALVTAKILDPACGSGAFPMGVLLRMVEILRILRGIPEDESVYELKLQLIENCIYGADIQCIAVQISKLRFFISLVCEQKKDDSAENYGINSLPNLETKFVAANSLIGLPQSGRDVLDLCTGDIAELKEELFEIRHRHFSAKTFQEKKKLRREDKKLRDSIKRTVRHDARLDRKHLELLLKERGKVSEPKWVSTKPVKKTGEMFSEFASKSATQTEFRADANEKQRRALDAEIAREHKREDIPSTEIDSIADMLASWDPYDQNTSASFLDPEWMFNVADGFHVVIGNPPYGRIFSKGHEETLSEKWPAFRATKDAYVAFMLHGFASAGKSGVECFIVPSAWLGGPGYELLRSEVLTRTISQIVSLPFDMFAAAYVDNAIFLVLNTDHPRGHESQVYAYPKKEALNDFVPGPWEKIRQDEWGYISGKKIILSSSGLALQKKLQANCQRTLRDVVEMRRGVLFDKRILTERRTGTRSFPYFEGDVYRYELHRRVGGWVTFGKDMKECPKSDKWFVGKRLLLRRLVNRRQRLMAALVDEDFITNKNLYSLLGKDCDLSLECVLALINSALMSRLYIDAVSQAVKDDFPQVTITDFLSIPIPTVVPPDAEKKLSALANRILLAKTADLGADVSALDSEIDQLVYKLYDLTPEEIAIVEERAAGSAKATGRSKAPKAKKKPARKRKTKQPPSLPGWD